MRVGEPRLGVVGMVEKEKFGRERVIVELDADLIGMIEDERRAAPGKLPSRSAIIRDLIEEAARARKAARGAV